MSLGEFEFRLVFINSIESLKDTRSGLQGWHIRVVLARPLPLLLQIVCPSKASDQP